MADNKTIGSESFRCCDNLLELKFADIEGWAVDGVGVDVTDFAENANKVKNDLAVWAYKTLVKTVSP